MTNTLRPTLARRFFHLFRGTAAPLLSACAVMFAGCNGGPQSPPPRDTGTEAGNLFSGPAAASARQEDATTAWTIAIIASRDQAVAAAALEKVQNKAGFRQAYLSPRGEAYVVSYGRYSSAADPSAQSDLKKIRSFQFEGGTPFADAVLAPPETLSVQGSIPELDLRSIHNDPNSRAKYTLQVGVYGRLDNKPPTPSDLAEFRRAAEQAAAKLRREGEEAYYYHGPSRSMVLIGAFDKGDYDEKFPGEADSPRLKAARERFPYNLVNGAGYKQKRIGAAEGSLQRSQVVRIPN